MNNEMLNLRRFFRNRFERLLDLDDADGSGAGDGSAIGLRELCGTLELDDQPFPQHYNGDFRRLCGHETIVWFREERSYGDVARLVGRVLEARDAGYLRPMGLWVSEVLRCDSLIEVLRRGYSRSV